MKILILYIVVYISSIQALAQVDSSVLVRQKEVLEYLDKYHFCQEGFSCIEHSFLSGNPLDYNDESKDRLLLLLKNVWSLKELDSIGINKINNQLKNEIDFVEMIINDTLKYPFGKKKRLEFEQRHDSLVMVKSRKKGGNEYFNIKVKIAKEQLLNKKVANEIIIICGMLGDERYLKFLKKTSKSSIKYEQNIVSLALARNGIDRYYEYIISRYSIDLPHRANLDTKLRYNVLRDYQERASVFLYICSQQSIKELAKWLTLTNTKYQIEAISHSDTYIPIANYAAKDLIDIIKNEDFRSHFSKGYSITSFTSADLRFIKKWLNKNFGNYNLDKTYLPRDLSGKLTYEYKN